MAAIIQGTIQSREEARGIAEISPKGHTDVVVVVDETKVDFPCRIISFEKAAFINRSSASAEVSS